MSKKKEIRKEFRDSVFKRDDFKCAWCGMPNYNDNMDAHHITDRSEMPNGGYVKENGISLCKKPIGLATTDGEDSLPDIYIENDSCHMKAEKFHISEGKEWEEEMHPDDLYRLIGSSYEEAIKTSERL